MCKQRLIDPETLITPAEYARSIGKTPAAVTKQMNIGKLQTIEVKGGRLIILPEKEK